MKYTHFVANRDGYDEYITSDDDRRWIVLYIPKLSESQVHTEVEATHGPIKLVGLAHDVVEALRVMHNLGVEFEITTNTK